MIEKNFVLQTDHPGISCPAGETGCGPAGPPPSGCTLDLSLEVHEPTDSAWILSEMISIQRIHHSQDKLKLRSTDLPHELLGFCLLVR